MKNYILIVIPIIFLTACSDRANRGLSNSPTSTSTSAYTTTYFPTDTIIASFTLTSSPVPTDTITLMAWSSLPVIPTGISSHINDVFQRGLLRGHDPTRFSKIGDCQNITPYFLSVFDNPSKFRLGPNYDYLQTTIDHFSGSWSRESLATHGGFNAATVMSSFWTLVSKPEVCNKGETPAACEIRVYNPSFAIISMEEAWSGDLQKYDHYMRMLVEFVLSQDVVPIIATRAELPDTKMSINETIAKIAFDYDIPLWNFGAATLVLPNFGLSPDGFHLTPGTVEGNYYFDDSTRMELGWTWRNLTALQAIDSVYRNLIEQQ